MGGPFLQLPHDGTALFAYGSLFCRGSLEQTLGRPYPLPLVVCRLRGWRRVWDVAMPNRTFFSDTSTGRLYPAGILYLNIDRRAASWVNGVLIVAGAAELELLDRREWIYARQDVTNDVDGVSVSGRRVFAYVGKPEHRVSTGTSPAEVAVRASYLEIVEAGLVQLGTGFRADYVRTTDPVPAGLVIKDRR